MKGSRLLKRIAVALVAAAMLFGLSLEATAHASTDGPHSFCLFNADQSCWQVNGVGNALSDTTNLANYMDVVLFSAPGGYVDIENGAGHCVYVNASGDVNEVSAACDGSSNENFAINTESGSNAFHLLSAETGHNVWVKDFGDGYTLHATKPPSGSWDQWGEYTTF